VPCTYPCAGKQEQDRIILCTVHGREIRYARAPSLVLKPLADSLGLHGFSSSAPRVLHGSTNSEPYISLAEAAAETAAAADAAAKAAAEAAAAATESAEPVAAAASEVAVAAIAMAAAARAAAALARDTVGKVAFAPVASVVVAGGSGPRRCRGGRPPRRTGPLGSARSRRERRPRLVWDAPSRRGGRPPRLTPASLTGVSE
jgi:hypothetical protein